MTKPFYIERDTEIKCEVTDNIILDLKDARLIKEIQLSNKSSNSLKYLFDSRPLIFPSNCQDFKCFINNKLTQLKKSRRGYNKVLTINEDYIVLEAGAVVRIEITCIWNNFHSIIKDFDYILCHPDYCSHRLVLSNYSPSEVPHIITIDDRISQEGNQYHILPNEIRFSPIQLSPNENIHINILSLFTLKELPILRGVISSNSKLFEPYAIIFIQHLLSDSIHLIESFNKLGAKKESIFIIGIPYSTKHTTVKFLKSKGYDNIVTPIEYPFDDYVNEVLVRAIKYCKEKSKEILIIEDGGYAVPLLHTKFINDTDLFIGAVEQTANGIWRDQEIQEKRSIDFKIPIINVAESEIKKDLESPLIGRTVSVNVELLINQMFTDIAGKKIGIIGLGSTGSEIARNLGKFGGSITVYDNDSSKLDTFKEAGLFKIADSIFDVLKNNEIIIEATGKYWSNNKREMRKIIFSFKHGSYFFSASSKRLGINHDIFLQLIREDSTINIPGFGKKYRLNREDKEITLIADGFPVNFFLGESVPDKNISFILAWLYKCAEILAIKNNEIPNGIIDTNDKEDNWGFYEAQNDIRDLDEGFNR